MRRPTLFDRSRYIALVVGLVVLFSLATSVRAQEQAVTLGIKPVGVDGIYFKLTMAPGESRELTIELGNYGTQKVRARTYAADAYTIVNGGFGAKLDGEPISGATRWLDYPADTIELESRAGIHRTFKINVPAEAQPGEYITGLAIQSADAQATNSSGIAIKQVVRQVIAVAISIPGPRVPRLEIGAPTYRTVAGKSLIDVVVKNTGNVHLKPSGEFVIRDASGAEISRYPVVMDTLYAGTSTNIEVPFAGRINPGDYKVMLALTDSDQHVQADAPTTPLEVPPPEVEASSAPVGEVPQPATINQPAAVSTSLSSIASSSSIMRLGLVAVCLAIGLALLGLFFARRLRRHR